MTVETDVPAPTHRADGAPAAAPATAAPALPAGNPALLALITFLPSALTLGLWFIGYLDTAKLPGGMIATLALSAGLFMLVATIWAGRIGASTLAATFTVGFVLVDLTFLLAFIAVVNGNRDWFTWAGVTTFAFCAVFAYVLVDGFGQDLGGKAMPMGMPLVR
jgi:uncharacterized protein